VSQLHEQMLLLNARVQELERNGGGGADEAAGGHGGHGGGGMTRTLALIKAALSPEQAAILGGWLKAADDNELAAAFDSCTLEDALPSDGSAIAMDSLRALAVGAGLMASSLPMSLGLGASPPAVLGGGGHLHARYGSLGADGGLAAAAAAHGPSGGGPFRARHSTAPITIGGRVARVRLGSRDTGGGGGSFPMESDDDAGSHHAGGGSHAVGSFSAGVHSGSLGAPPLGATGAGGLARSWDDIESAQAILALHGATPPHANSYNVQSMDLQFQ
jgi:hypothetical protein